MVPLFDLVVFAFCVAVSFSGAMLTWIVWMWLIGPLWWLPATALAAIGMIPGVWLIGRYFQ